MKRYIGLCAVVAVVVAGSATPAVAQPARDEWKVLVAPYLMGAAMSGATTVRGATVDVDVSASDIFSNLQFGAMGIVVARKGDWGFGADADLDGARDDRAGHQRRFQSGRLRVLRPASSSVRPPM